MREELDRFKHQDTSLRRYLNENRVLMDNTATKELNIRYLEPHHQDDEQFQLELEMQCAAIEQAREKIVVAEENRLAALDAEKKVEEFLATTQEGLRNAEKDYNTSCDFNQKALALFPQIAQLITQANSVCP